MKPKQDHNMVMMYGINEPYHPDEPVETKTATEVELNIDIDLLNMMTTKIKTLEKYLSELFRTAVGEEPVEGTSTHEQYDSVRRILEDHERIQKELKDALEKLKRKIDHEKDDLEDKAVGLADDNDHLRGLLDDLYIMATGDDEENDLLALDKAEAVKKMLMNGAGAVGERLTERKAEMFLHSLANSIGKGGGTPKEHFDRIGLALQERLDVGAEVERLNIELREYRVHVERLCKAAGFEIGECADDFVTSVTSAVEEIEDLQSKYDTVGLRDALEEIYEKLFDDRVTGETDGLMVEAILNRIHAMQTGKKHPWVVGSPTQARALEREANMWCEKFVNARTRVWAAVKQLKDVAVAEEDIHKFSSAMKLIEDI